MPQTLVTAPTSKPITLQDAKDHLRVLENDDDRLIKVLLASAVEDAEDYTRRKFITQTWKYFINNFTNEIQIPFGKLQSVSSVKYYDVNDTQQTLSSSVYIVDADSTLGRVVLASTQSWPSIYDRPNPIEIEFVCGYGAASAVPETIKHAIKTKVEILYGNLFDNEVNSLEKTYKNLLNQYRLFEF